MPALLSNRVSSEIHHAASHSLPTNIIKDTDTKLSWIFKLGVINGISDLYSHDEFSSRLPAISNASWATGNHFLPVLSDYGAGYDGSFSPIWHIDNFPSWTRIADSPLLFNSRPYRPRCEYPLSDITPRSDNGLPITNTGLLVRCVTGYQCPFCAEYNTYVFIARKVDFKRHLNELHSNYRW